MLSDSEQALKRFLAMSCRESTCALCIYDGVNTGLGRMPVMPALCVGYSKHGGCGLEKV